MFLLILSAQIWPLEGALNKLRFLFVFEFQNVWSHFLAFVRNVYTISMWAWSPLQLCSCSLKDATRSLWLSAFIQHLVRGFIIISFMYKLILEIKCFPLGSQCNKEHRLQNGTINSAVTQPYNIHRMKPKYKKIFLNTTSTSN